jgi:hypothetical protein
MSTVLCQFEKEGEGRCDASFEVSRPACPSRDVSCIQVLKIISSLLSVFIVNLARLIHSSCEFGKCLFSGTNAISSLEISFHYLLVAEISIPTFVPFFHFISFEL